MNEVQVSKPKSVGLTALVAAVIHNDETQLSTFGEFWPQDARYCATYLIRDGKADWSTKLKVAFFKTSDNLTIFLNDIYADENELERYAIRCYKWIWGPTVLEHRTRQAEPIARARTIELDIECTEY